MLQWSEKRRTVEITATCLGPPDQPVLWISCKKNSLAWGCELIQDYPWKHHISVVVSSPAGSNTEGPILSQNLLWKLFNMFSLLQRIKPLSSSGHFPLSWLSGIRDQWTQQGQELVQGLCQCTVGDIEQGICSSPCLDRAPCPSWVTDLSNCTICLINISPLPLIIAFLQPVGHNWLCWPGLFGGTSWPPPLPAPASLLGI